jgi:hypothetical protein
MESGKNSETRVTATNGSIGVGNIQVGGNLSGNITIGNKDQVNNKE